MPAYVHGPRAGSECATGVVAVIRAGVARVPITPPIGVVHMRGFANRHQPAQSAHDPLLATALVLADDGGPRACLIVCDLCALSPGDSGRFEARVGALIGVPGEAVWIACSHTHSGPRVSLAGSGSAPELAYSVWLMDQLAGCAFSAALDLRPAALGSAMGESRIGVNRRERKADGRTVLGSNPAGPVDHRTTLIRIEDGDGRPLAAVVHHACHPVVLGPESYALSADYVGYARAAAEAVLGVPVLFVQGACGNINPVARGSFAVAERLGQRLGGEAVRLWSEADAQPLKIVRTAARRFTVDLGPLPAPDEAQGEVHRRREQLAREEAAGRPGGVAAARMYLASAETRLRATEAGAAGAELTLRAMRWNDVGFVAAPFEPFVETGVAVREDSPHRPLLFCGYTGGVLTYIPVAEAYPEGGYEVADAYLHFGLPAPPLPATEGRLRGTFAELLAGL